MSDNGNMKHTDSWADVSAAADTASGKTPDSKPASGKVADGKAGKSTGDKASGDKAASGKTAGKKADKTTGKTAGEKAEAAERKADKAAKKTEKAARKAEKKAKRETPRQWYRRRKEEFNPENPRRFMIVSSVIAALVVVFGIFLTVRYIMNEVFLSKYEDQVYETGIPETLEHANIPEGYLPYYNEGNVNYMNEDYDAAIGNYLQALTYNPPEKKGCSIRINLALAMLHKIDFDNLETDKDIESAIRQLRAARRVLVEDGCASPGVGETGGHSETAEQLKKDIDDMLEELGADPEDDDEEDSGDDEDQQSGEEDTEEESGDSSSETRREQEVREELEEQQQENMQERRESDEQKYRSESASEDEQSGSSSGGGSEEDDTTKNW